MDALQHRFPQVLEANRKSFAGATGLVEGFGAGDAYPQIWLRDSATLMPLARFYYPRAVLTRWLEEHLAHQEDSGALYDWVAPGDPARFPYAPRARLVYGDGATAVTADKNTTEADQESSAVLAAACIHAVLGDPGWLRRDVRGRPLLTRLDLALRFVLRERSDPGTGLVINALTADWGDVSPLYPDQRAIYLDEHTPLVVGLYTNALFVGAARALADLHEAVADGQAAKAWRREADRVSAALETTLWRREWGFFAIHADVAPRVFRHDDDGIFALGGHAVAALNGVLSADRLAGVLAVAERRQRASGIDALAGTLLPPYPTGFFAHPVLREAYTYQNGGQWDWFSGRLLLALFERGQAETARRHLSVIARRVEAAGGLFEWYTVAGEGRGSNQYAGSAGALGRAVVEGLFGVGLDASGLTLQVRLGSQGGSIALEEPATGRFVRYTYAVATSGPRLRWKTWPAPRSLAVRLPLGRSVRRILLNGKGVVFERREVGADQYVVIAPAPPEGDLQLDLVAEAAESNPSERQHP